MHRLSDRLTIGAAAKLRGVSVDTIRRWSNDGKLKYETTEGKHRRFMVADILKVDKPDLRFTVCYGRVSTREKKDDLQRQISVLELYCQERGWDQIATVQDIGSGINYKKKGLFNVIRFVSP